MKNAKVVFEGKEIRKFTKGGEQWICGLDIFSALGYSNLSQSMMAMFDRNRDRLEQYSITAKMPKAEGGFEKRRETLYFNLRGIVAICMLSKQPQALPFQRWADDVLAREISNMPDDIRLVAKRRRIEFTDTLKNHGINKPREYAGITNGMKDNLGIERKPKSDCDLIEVAKIAAAEMLARATLMASEANGYSEVRPVCNNSAATVARSIAENSGAQKQLTQEAK